MHLIQEAALHWSWRSNSAMLEHGRQLSAMGSLKAADARVGPELEPKPFLAMRGS
jgi:hypothetical protein